MASAIRDGRGLRKLSPEMLAEAHDQTVASVTRATLTLVGVSLFCTVSLFAPDSSLLTGNWGLFDLPFAGPVSFQGLLIGGPIIIVGLRVYLQIYFEHWQRLEKIRRRFRTPILRPPLVSMRKLLLRWFHGFAVYLALPLTMIWFSWKAAMFPIWGSGLAHVTAVILAVHLVQWVPRTWPWTPLARAVLMAELASFGAIIVYVEGPMSRPADLISADLSDQWLPDSYLRGANLQRANLRGANLSGADLQHADLSDADFTGADLTEADLSFVTVAHARLERWRHTKLEVASVTSVRLKNADLFGANLLAANLAFADLTDAYLGDADLTDALLEGANLRGANLPFANLTRADLEGANFRSAYLRRAILEEAWLYDAGLLGADLTGANLKRAYLGRAGLQSTKLEGADLTGAVLDDASMQSASGLTREQLKGARCNEGTVLPSGLNPERDCGSWQPW